MKWVLLANTNIFSVHRPKMGLVILKVLAVMAVMAWLFVKSNISFQKFFQNAGLVQKGNKLLGAGCKVLA